MSQVISNRPDSAALSRIAALHYRDFRLYLDRSFSFQHWHVDASYGGKLARSTMLQWTTPNELRGRVMGIFQIATQGLNPMGQVETGVVVPLIGARAATFFGGSIVLLITLLTTFRIREIERFRLGVPNEKHDQ